MQLSDESFWPQARIDFCLALLNASGDQEGDLLTYESARWIHDFVPRYLPSTGSLLRLSQGLTYDLIAWADSSIGDQSVREHLGRILYSASISSFYGKARIRDRMSACRMVAALCLRRDLPVSWLDVGRRMMREKILPSDRAGRALLEDWTSALRERNISTVRALIDASRYGELAGAFVTLVVSNRRYAWYPDRIIDMILRHVFTSTLVTVGNVGLRTCRSML